jgi:hypothetical protein
VPRRLLWLRPAPWSLAALRERIGRLGARPAPADRPGVVTVTIAFGPPIARPAPGCLALCVPPSARADPLAALTEEQVAQIGDDPAPAILDLHPDTSLGDFWGPEGE